MTSHKKYATPAVLMLPLLLLLLVSGCALLKDTGVWEKPEAALSTMKLSQLSFDGAILDVTVDVFNPNPYKIKLGQLDYALSVQDRQVFEGRHDKSTTLNAKQSQSILFPVQVRFEDLFAAVSDLKNENIIAYGLDGGVSFDLPVVGPLRIPFSRQGRLPVPRLPTISVKALELESLNMLGATLKLLLTMKNPNDFGLNLNRFDYSFKLNNNSVAGGKSAAALAAGPGETVSFELPLDLSFAGAGLALYKLLKGGGNLDYQLSINGEAGSNHELLSGFPFNSDKTGSIKLSR